jgi:hypothetical protein
MRALFSNYFRGFEISVNYCETLILICKKIVGH